MDNQNNDLKPLNLTNLSQVDLSKIINSDITKIPIMNPENKTDKTVKIS